MSKISVIIPVFNAEKYIERTINSVLEQKNANFEIIVVNDGSSDSSQKIIENLIKSNDNIKLVNQKNKGVSSARNNGLDNSSGDYVVFLDADDILPKDSLFLMLSKIESENADICFGKTKVINLNQKENIISNSTDIEIYDRREAMKHFLYNDSEFDLHSSCAKMYRFEKIKNIRFEENRSSNEDRFYLFEVINKVNTIVCIPNIVYFYEKHENSLSTKLADSRLFDNIYFADKMIKVIDSDYNDLKEAAIYNQIITYMMVYRNFYRSNKTVIKNNIKRLNEIRKEILKLSKNEINLGASKNIEIIIIKYFKFIYKLVIMIYDTRR